MGIHRYCAYWLAGIVGLSGWLAYAAMSPISELSEANMREGLRISDRPAPFSWPLLDSTPIFISSPPTTEEVEALKATVLRVRVRHYLNAGQCTHPQPTSPPEIPVEPDPTRYAYAEVIEVVRGTYDQDTVMVCAGNAAGEFKIGDSGLVWGKLSANRKGEGRLVIAETFRQLISRRIRETTPEIGNLLGLRAVPANPSRS